MGCGSTAGPGSLFPRDENVPCGSHQSTTPPRNRGREEVTVKRAAVVLLSLLLAPTASRAVKVEVPIEGVTLNVGLQLQTQFIVNEAGTPDGRNPSFDLNIRRSRLNVNGDVGSSFSYFFQIDNANFGKFG